MKTQDLQAGGGGSTVPPLLSRSGNMEVHVGPRGSLSAGSPALAVMAHELMGHAWDLFFTGTSSERSAVNTETNILLQLGQQPYQPTSAEVPRSAVKKSFILMLVMLISSACERSGSASATVVSVERGAVVVEVQNTTSKNIVVLSSEAPSRQVDEKQCVLIISTRVTDDVRPYAFTPTLETVEAGSARRFRAVLAPVALSATSCTEWTINAEYAYMWPEAVTTFKGRPFEDFRQFVLRNQKVITASAELAIRN